MVASYARLAHVAAELSPFAAFLVQLKMEVAGRAASRGEIIGWLQTLATDDSARSRAFRMVSAAHATGTALQTYLAIREASQ